MPIVIKTNISYTQNCIKYAQDQQLVLNLIFKTQILYVKKKYNTQIICHEWCCK